ncbi:MAG: DUF2948 family protein [Alphaproteobacteria bacterium]|nr:DUF2948 family protein [Alphaproteobacteria bacterium]
MRLRLKAEDDEDLAVISAVLQDAMVLVGDITYEPENQRFVLVANRFRHENDVERARRGERVMSGLRVDRVTAVKRRDFDPRDAERLMVLLAVRSVPGAIYLDFAGGASIRLESGGILCHLDDFGEPWPTRFRPHHPDEDAG